MSKKIFWCKNCLNISTAPRIAFDDRGWCNTCRWMKEKKKIDLELRQKESVSLLDKNRSKNENFDFVVSVCGEKDTSYIAYIMDRKSSIDIYEEIDFKIVEVFLGN